MATTEGDVTAVGRPAIEEPWLTHGDIEWAPKVSSKSVLEILHDHLCLRRVNLLGATQSDRNLNEMLLKDVTIPETTSMILQNSLVICLGQKKNDGTLLFKQWARGPGCSRIPKNSDCTLEHQSFSASSLQENPESHYCDHETA